MSVTDHTQAATIRLDPITNALPERDDLLDKSLLVLDEISMLRKDQLDCVSTELHRISFTGVVLLCGNDAQLAPVLPQLDVADVPTHHVVESKTYESATHFTLTKNHRIKDDASGSLNAKLSALCLSLGYGLMARVPAEVCRCFYLSCAYLFTSQSST